jgi:biopolymer transport protein TolR
MATVGSRGKRRIVNEINVVPYIDVMLVLLVIFMVTAPLVPSGVVDLPSAGKSNSAPDAYAEIQVRVGGRYTLTTHGVPKATERETDRQGLDKVVDAVHQADPELAFVISGERKVPYEDVISVMSALRQRGIQRVALMVKSVPG